MQTIQILALMSDGKAASFITLESESKSVFDERDLFLLLDSIGNRTEPRFMKHLTKCVPSTRGINGNLPVVLLLLTMFMVSGTRITVSLPGNGQAGSTVVRKLQKK